MDSTVSKEEARLAKYRQGLQDQIKKLQKEIDKNNKDSNRQQDYINKLSQLLFIIDEEAEAKVYNDEYERYKAELRKKRLKEAANLKTNAP